MKNRTTNLPATTSLLLITVVAAKASISLPLVCHRQTPPPPHIHTSRTHPSRFHPCYRPHCMPPRHQQSLQQPLPTTSTTMTLAWRLVLVKQQRNTQLITTCKRNSWRWRKKRVPVGDPTAACPSVLSSELLSVHISIDTEENMSPPVFGMPILH